MKKLLSIILVSLMFVALVPIRTIKAAETHTHDTITFDSEWTSDNSLPSEDGNYYLTKDVTLNASATISSGKTINLCLNGHVINLNCYHIEIATGGTLHVYNCDNETEHKGYVDANGLWHLDESESHSLGVGEVSETIIGGIVTGAGTLHSNAFYVTGGTLTLDSIAICGNETLANTPGGAMRIHSGTVEISDCTITRNTATKGGGGIYVLGGILTIKSGKIINNVSTYGGGIVMSSSNPTVYLTADNGKEIEITGNKATNSGGGGICSYSNNVHLSGKVIVKNNTSAGDDYPKNVLAKYAFNIDDALTGSEIYVSHGRSSDDKHDIGVLTSGYKEKNPNAELNTFFHYEGPTANYMGININGELETIQIPDSNYRILIPYTIDNSIVSDVPYAESGATVTLTVKTISGFEYLEGSLKVNGSTEGISSVGDGKYTFTMPDAVAEVTAIFTKVYEIIEGKEAKINVNDGKSTLFTSEADFSKFVEVLIDENVVDPSNYIVSEGSTKVTLKASYLATLVNGTHTISIVSTDGKAKTTFTVNDNSSTPSSDSTPRYKMPNTGVE